MTRLVITERERMALNIAKALGSYSKRSLGTSGRRRASINTYEVTAAEGEGQLITILPLRGHIMNCVTRRELERWTHPTDIMEDGGGDGPTAHQPMMIETQSGVQRVGKRQETPSLQTFAW